MAKYKLIVDGRSLISHDNLSWLCDRAMNINRVCEWAKAHVEKDEEVKNG